MDKTKLLPQRQNQELSDIDANYPRIFRYILSMVHDPVDAEDLTQETFLRAQSQKEFLRDPKAQIAWVYRIATNVCLDWFRQNSRLASKLAEIDPDEVEIVDEHQPSLQKVIEQAEMSECVQSYLTRLADHYRSVILLHDVHGLTAPEIAEFLDESLANVKIRLHRARQKLRAALELGCAFSCDDRGVLQCETKS